MSFDRIRAIAGNELRQVVTGRDYLRPLGGLAALFFVVIPTVLLGLISSIEATETINAVSVIVDTLPDAASDNVRGTNDGDKAAYALAVYLLAPIAIVVPLTSATAIGATAIVGESTRFV